MKLSTKARYGLRAMLALAQSPEGASRKVISENHNLPAAYLEQLMARLRNAKLVVAMRGARGKYVLARDADKITLAEIVEALEGPIEIVDCSDISNCCFDPDVCVLRDIFDGATRVFYDYLDGITLAELAERQTRQETSSKRMYYI
jgi:Rrf2 family protein